jgi:hypothetical protein
VEEQGFPTKHSTQHTLLPIYPTEEKRREDKGRRGEERGGIVGAITRFMHM